jgi:acyl carrier protein
MTHEQVLAKVKQILQADFRVSADRVTPDAAFRGGLGLDSLDAVDLIYLLSKEFGLKPDIEQFRDLDTVQKVVEFLAKKSQEKAT